MADVTTLDHPLAAHHLTLLRDAATTPYEFRQAVRRLTGLLAYEATSDLIVERRMIRTPLAEHEGRRLAQRIALVPILRAGLGMLEPMMDLLPSAEVWHIGLYRDEATLQPVEYYKKIPGDDPPDAAIVIDPMLATGGSAAAALSDLRQWGVRRLKLVCLLAAPEGLQTVIARHPDAQIYTCAVDLRLNEAGYIVPGLGDAGDRIYNTPEGKHE